MLQSALLHGSMSDNDQLGLIRCGSTYLGYSWQGVVGVRMYSIYHHSYHMRWPCMRGIIGAAGSTDAPLLCHLSSRTPACLLILLTLAGLSSYPGRPKGETRVSPHGVEDARERATVSQRLETKRQHCMHTCQCSKRKNDPSSHSACSALIGYLALRRPHPMGSSTRGRAKRIRQVSPVPRRPFHAPCTPSRLSPPASPCNASARLRLALHAEPEPDAGLSGGGRRALRVGSGVGHCVT